MMKRAHKFPKRANSVGDVEGDKLKGHISAFKGRKICISARSASGHLDAQVIAIIVAPVARKYGTRTISSCVAPDLLSSTTLSLEFILAMFPVFTKNGSTKAQLTPTEESVAANICPRKPDLPTPENLTLPTLRWADTTCT